jgi:Carbohydrate esterase, sialic acid-specific acetylesterase
MKYFTTLITALALSQSIYAEKSDKKPLKVFILAGQSNMQGQGMVTSQDEKGSERPGTLLATLHDRAKGKMLRHLVNAKGEWAEKRDDVWIYDISELGERHGPLEFGYGWDLGSRVWFGPELQFGQLMGDRLENQVLIIKTAWGGRDLYKDFRPPSAGGTAGPFYTEMIGTVKKVLGSLETQFPDYHGRGYELAGFVWWHGWNDFCSPAEAAPAYEANLTHLIHDVRRDLKVPKLPIVIGEFTGPWGADCPEPTAVMIRNAQKQVAKKAEFVGSVKFVETHDFVRKVENSPSDEIYHEFKNGETYFLVGDALGKGMVDLLGR